jgi:hypothetical protein
MFVIQHKLTNERFMFPHYNVTKETYEGFDTFQVLPIGFSIADDQTPVSVTYQSDTATTLVKWEANSDDPLKIMNKWEND